MSIHLHIGQCGNQLGAAYWHLASASSELHEEYRKRDASVANKQNCRASRVPNAAINGSKKLAPLSRHLFHPSSGTARCILVDSEPKVIQSVVENATGGATGFQPACTHVEQAGRGNNWAMGYYGPRRKAPASAFTSLSLDDRRELVERVMDSVQRELESVDSYQGSVVMHSLGGGTGSGLGCRVLENLRDTYPKAYIVTASVAPSYTHGDTPLQNYNAVLTLRCLQEVADAVIYKDNDDLLHTARYWKALVQERAGTDCTNQRVSLDEINSMVAADLAGLLFPVDMGEVDNARPFDFGKLLHDVCPMPTIKMIDVRSTVWRDRVGSGVRSKLPSKTSVAKGVSSAALFHAPVVAESRSLSLRHGQADGFDASLEILEKLVQQACGAFPRTYNTVMASSTIVRGFIPATCDRDRFSEKLGGSIHTAFPPVPWLTGMPQATLTYSRSEPFPALKGKASATICVNNGNFLASTKRFLERAQRQFHASAYIHWYKQHGIEDGDFETAFTECATLVSEYEALLR